MRALHYATLLVLLPAVGLAAAPAGKDLGAHHTGTRGEFQQVIERRCVLCHTTAPIELAIRQKTDVEQLERQMTEHGAVLSERGKSVLGTFWGMPLKDRQR